MADEYPYFKFYPADFMGSAHVQMMEPAALGVYVRLLCASWQLGALPADTGQLARLSGVVPEEFGRIWPQVKPCWRERSDGFVNPRLEKERAAAERRRVHARRAAEDRWSDPDDDAPGSAPGNAGSMPGGMPPRARPRSSEAQNSQSTESQRETITARTRENGGDVENSATAIILEANRGLSENENLDRPARPIQTGHISRADVLDWLKEGIDPEFAAERVRAIARDYRPAQPKQQIHSMAYFSGAVREAWDERKQAEVKARLDELDHEQKAREREARSRELPPDPPPMREPKRENQLESVSAFTERYIGRAEA